MLYKNKQYIMIPISAFFTPIETHNGIANRMTKAHKYIN